jgi:hypothetical protein
MKLPSNIDELMQHPALMLMSLGLVTGNMQTEQGVGSMR